ncbi:MAG TPA: ribonuclease III [Candidatus Limnocylindrales bacterium]|nr:ribonuclease III [Candidatus Limnocylindrales bacterium]
MRRRSGPSRTPSTTSTSTAHSNRPAAGPGRQRPPRPRAGRPETLGRIRDLRLPAGELPHLDEALVHSSFPNEHPGVDEASNERLEFLGDAVIQLVVSEALHAGHPEDDEGRLTARRAAIVSTAGLAAVAERLHLGEYLRLGQGAERTGERHRPSILAAGLEAVAACLYLDRGLDAARAWVREVCGPELSRPEPADAFVSAKSRLQELGYARDGRAPVYRVVRVDGPDHARHYVVEALVAGTVLGHGEGRNRRAAETQAAEAALAAMEAAGR